MLRDAASLRHGPSPAAATELMGESHERIQSWLSSKGGRDLCAAKPKRTRGTRSGGVTARRGGKEGMKGVKEEGDEERGTRWWRSQARTWPAESCSVI